MAQETTDTHGSSRITRPVGGGGHVDDPSTHDEYPVSPRTSRTHSGTWRGSTVTGC